MALNKPETDRLESVYVDRPAALEDAVAAVSRAPVVSFDTEFIGESTYEPQLCLLQVATPEAIFVVDPLAGVDLTAFWQALTRPGVEVVAHASRQELLFCLRYAGRLPGTVFDPQIAAGFLGFGYPLSHTNLVQRVLGIRVAGGETYTDWQKRPLTRRQLDYAADDVRHLLAARTVLTEQAEARGRLDWIHAECAKVAQRLVDRRGEERWTRISGASRLNRRELAVLRELWRWRDEAARSADVPPRRILSDDLLLQIVRRSPRSVTDLLVLRGMDRPALRRLADRIYAAVQAGLAVPNKELPRVLRRDEPPQVSALAQVMSILSTNIAAEHGIDSALLATNADLQDVVRWKLGLTTEENPPALLEGWRGELLGQSLISLLEGRSSVSVADIRSPTPLRIERRGEPH